MQAGPPPPPPPARLRPTRPDEQAGLRGVLLGLSPGPLLLHLGLRGPEALGSLAGVGACAATVLLALGAVLLPGQAPLGRWLGVLGAALGVVLSLPALLDQPGLGFGALLLAGAAITRAWPARPQAQWAASPQAEARGAAVAALVLCTLALPGGLVQSPAALGVALGGPAVAGGLGARAAWAGEARWVPVAVGLVLALGAVGLAWPAAEPSLLGALAAPLGGLWATRQGHGTSERGASFAAEVLAHPARTMVLSFAALGLLGGMALSTPICGQRAGGVAFLDALFTAVSASCVTGLGVVDTVKDFSLVGQGVILALIQVGGLGIMTFSTAAMALFGMRLSLRHERTAAGLVGSGAPGALLRDLRQVLAVTFGVEALGALVLALCFRSQGDELPMSLWRGVFTSISAFCNAGFALQSDSLVSYAQDPLVLHTVGALIVLGGLGPPVVLALPLLVRGRRVPLQARLVWVSTLALLVGPAVLIGAVEWEQSLVGLAPVDRLHNAWFQSVTLRTAGFNSVDMTALHPATVALMMLCMFVGGSPGSTAGGIKTTTAALLVLAVVAVARGRPAVAVYGRTLPHEAIYRAMAITTVGALVGALALFAMLGTQAMPFEVALFEVVSALGTVGLSVGATPLLDEVGKVLILLCMYMGRIGPLTLFLLLTEVRAAAPSGLPEEGVAIG